MWHLIIPALLVWPGIALAQDCEAIKDAFSYNECLAKAGPPRGDKARQSAAGEPEESVPAHKHSALPKERQNGVHITRSGKSRTSAIIDPWAGARGAPRSKRRR